MYQALYRKWRPRSFDDVISQPHITTALRNQIREEKTAHAYLFTGSRGTGKTTCARILAKTVNCEHRTPEGNPCLECEICRDAERGALADIIEIDAASNRGIDEIREIVAPIAKQHGVDKVFLFGSYARGDATPASDVDLCVDAPKLRGLFALGGLYADLEDALKKSIDVVTTGSLKYNKDEAFLENLRKDRVLLYELS